MSRNDPVEEFVACTLIHLGIDYKSNVKVGDRELDFYLPDYDIYIECKQFYTPRILDQMSEVENVIVVQGLETAHVMFNLARMLVKL